MSEHNRFEWYPTPRAFTQWLFREVHVEGRIFEPCVGDRAIPADAIGQWRPEAPIGVRRDWITNDLDSRWKADYHFDASRPWPMEKAGAYVSSPSYSTELVEIDWVVTNPPFTLAIEILEQALKYATVGVAMHLRASIHEVLKTGIRRTWMRQHTPTGVLWLPRFAYQRSPTTGKWTTDSVCACWVIWLKDPVERQFMRYAPEWVIDQLDDDTLAYRRRMDAFQALPSGEPTNESLCL